MHTTSHTYKYTNTHTNTHPTPTHTVIASGMASLHAPWSLSDCTIIYRFVSVLPTK